MKKILMILMMVAIPALTMASGKLMIKPMYMPTEKQYLMPQVGLSVYEKVGPVALNSWIGTGEPILNENPEGDRWFSMKHAVDFYVKKITVSPGFEVHWMDDQWGKRKDIMFINFGYKLWD